MRTTTYRHVMMGAALVFLATATPLVAEERNTQGSSSGWRRFGESRSPGSNTAAATANDRVTASAGDGQPLAANEGSSPGVEFREQANQPVRAVADDASGRVQIPAGTWITVRADQMISTRGNMAGDRIGLTLVQPVIAGGRVLARRGQTVTGNITNVVQAGRVKGTARLVLEVSELTLADGQQLPVHTQLVEIQAGTSRGSDTAAIATTTGVGAAIGAAAAGGSGAGLGAIAGAGASAIGVLLSRGRHVEIPPESVLRFRLTEAVTVDTERTLAAFRTVEQSDFDSAPLQRRSVQRQPAWGFPGGGWGYPGWGWDPWLYGPGWGWGPRLYVGNGWGWGGGWGGGWRGGGWGGGGWRGGGGRGGRR